MTVRAARLQPPLLAATPWLLAACVLPAAAAASLWLTRSRPSAGEVIWLVAFAIPSTIRMPHVWVNRASRVLQSAHDLSERLLLPAMFLTMAVLPLVNVMTPWLHFAACRLPAAAGWFGTLLTLGYLLVFWRSHADLRRN